MTKLTYYDLLDVPVDASIEGIISAYRRHAMKLHPDRNPNPAAHDAFTALGVAYAVLSDPARRAEYDRSIGLFARAEPFHFNGFSSSRGPTFGHVFEEQWLHDRQNGEPSPPRGKSITRKVKISLAEQITGCTRDIEIRRSGSCARCAGSGQINSRKAKCPACDGSGRSESKKKIAIVIPAGTEPGDRLRCVGQGAFGADHATAGDLCVVVDLARDELFEVAFPDLRLIVPISALFALVGGALLVPTPIGSRTVDIAPGTQNGQQLPLAQEGLARLGGTQRGVLHLHFQVQPLNDVSPGVRALVGQLDERLREEDPASSIAQWERKVDAYLRQRNVARDNPSARG